MNLKHFQVSNSAEVPVSVPVVPLVFYTQAVQQGSRGAGIWQFIDTMQLSFDLNSTRPYLHLGFSGLCCRLAQIPAILHHWKHVMLGMDNFKVWMKTSTCKDLQGFFFIPGDLQKNPNALLAGWGRILYCGGWQHVNWGTPVDREQVPVPMTPTFYVLVFVSPPSLKPPLRPRPCLLCPALSLSLLPPASSAAAISELHKTRRQHSPG